MTPRRRRPLRWLAVLALLAGLHLVLARWLLSVDLMQRLLAPSGGGVIVPALYLLLRLALVCLGSGLLAASLFVLLWPAREL